MTRSEFISIALIVLLAAAVFGLPPALWLLAKPHASRVANGGPLTWAFAFMALPCGVLMYALTRRYRKRHVRLLAAMVAFSPLLSVCIAVLIASLTGVLVSLTALNFPMFGASLGWQLGGALYPREASEP